MARKLYIMETIRHGQYGESGGVHHSYMLWEMTPAELAQAQADAEQANKTPDVTVKHVRYERVTGQYAHGWVRRDRPHMTALWLDGDRIRYATG